MTPREDYTNGIANWIFLFETPGSGSIPIFFEPSSYFFVDFPWDQTRGLGELGTC